MPLDVSELIGGALGGAIVSSIVAPLVTQRLDRRQSRAEVLRAIAAVERSRWGHIERDQFLNAVIALRSAALVAGARRELTDRYIELCEQARSESEAGFETSGVPEDGSISRALVRSVSDAAEALVEHVWHPWRTWRP
ncbi:MAG TPA: hypothetical protein VK506_00265 [Conexibacter sp.]|nr:hypothetical protein [Conexibacter sp.]